MLSTLDWALIDTWREAGIPLEAVLRGIDTAFDRYEARKHRVSRRINGLAWCAQEVITAAEEMREAALGTANPKREAANAGLEWERIAAHLTRTAGELRSSRLEWYRGTNRCGDCGSSRGAGGCFCVRPEPGGVGTQPDSPRRETSQRPHRHHAGSGPDRPSRAERPGTRPLSAPHAGPANPPHRTAVSPQTSSGKAQSSAAQPLLYEAGVDSVVKLRIQKPIYGGSGLAHADGKAIFVPLTLTGEEVEAQIVSDKGGFATAELQAVLEPSPGRIAPPCPYFGQCGGCHYQYATYSAQVEMKVAILRESLERAHLREIPDITPVTAEPLGYRNRIRLHVQKNPFSLSYKLRNSREDLPIESCLIAAPILQRAIHVLNREGVGVQMPASVTEVELFTDSAEKSLLLSLWTDCSAGVAKQFCERTALSLRPILPGTGRDRYLRHRKGPRHKSPSGSHRGSVAPLRCCHVHLQGQYWLFLSGQSLSDRSSGPTRYGGRGWTRGLGSLRWGRPLLPPAGRALSMVTAVESSPAAVGDLRENLRGTRHRVVASDTVAFLRRAVTQRQPSPDLVVVDPPRAGLGRDVTTALGKIRPRKVTYVSCDPATLSSRPLRVSRIRLSPQKNASAGPFPADVPSRERYPSLAGLGLQEATRDGRFPRHSANHRCRVPGPTIYTHPMDHDSQCPGATCRNWFCLRRCYLTQVLVPSRASCRRTRCAVLRDGTRRVLCIAPCACVRSYPLRHARALLR